MYLESGLWLGLNTSGLIATLFKFRLGSGSFIYSTYLDLSSFGLSKRKLKKRGDLPKYYWSLLYIDAALRRSSYTAYDYWEYLSRFLPRDWDIEG